MTDWFEVFGHLSLTMFGVLMVLPAAWLVISHNQRYYRERLQDLDEYYMSGRRRTAHGKHLPTLDAEMVLMLSHEQWNRLPFEAKHHLRLLPMMDNGQTYAVKLTAKEYREMERRLMLETES